MGAALAAMSGAAPAEFADDFEVLGRAYSNFAAALEDAGVDFNDPGSLSSREAQATLATAGEAFASTDVDEAFGEHQRTHGRGLRRL